MFADSQVRYFGARGKDGIGKRGAKFRTTPEKDEALMPPLSPQDLKVGMVAQGTGGHVPPHGEWIWAHFCQNRVLVPRT